MCLDAHPRKIDANQKPSVTAYLSLGSNLGERQSNLINAIHDLSSQAGIVVTGVSSLYETDPVGITDQPAFLNCVVVIQTRLKPLELLAICQSIETKHGRRRLKRWGPRTIDIDLLTVDAIVCRTDRLTLPHPRMHERPFVQIPLQELKTGQIGEAPGVRCIEKQWFSGVKH